MKSYTCIHKVRHDGKQYEAGDLVELDEKSANILLDLGSIEESTDTSGTKGSADESAELFMEILGILPYLDKDKDFTSGGLPKVASVEKALGKNVSADDVKLAWEKHTVKEDSE